MFKLTFLGFLSVFSMLAADKPVVTSKLITNAVATQASKTLTFNFPDNKQPQHLDQYKGKVVALEFVSTTCPHCQQATRDMMMNEFMLSKYGFQAVDVAVNTNKESEIKDFQKEYSGGIIPVGYTSLQEMFKFLVFNESDRFVVPQIVLIDRHGNIRYKTDQRGEHDLDLRKSNELSQKIVELIKEKN